MDRGVDDNAHNALFRVDPALTELRQSNYQQYLVPPTTAALAVDPATGRIWIADDLTNEVWSCAPDGTSSQRELSFPLTNPSQPDYQMDFHEPGMTFAPNGSFVVLTDTSTMNGGGRLLIFNNETFTIPSFPITQYSRTAQGLALVHGMKVRWRMVAIEHADDDPVKPAEFRPSRSLLLLSGAASQLLGMRAVISRRPQRCLVERRELPNLMCR